MLAFVYKDELEGCFCSQLLLGKSLHLGAKGEMKFAIRSSEESCICLWIVRTQEEGKNGWEADSQNGLFYLFLALMEPGWHEESFSYTVLLHSHL